MFRSTLLAATAAIALSSPAFAQQEGLVNVDVSGNTIQVPVSAAAQVCGIDADVLTANFVDTDEVACRIDQETAARHNIGGQGGGQDQGGGAQQGLVNVDVSGNTIQIPVSAAVQVCGIDADVLTANFVDTDEVACRIDQETAARHNIGGNQGGAQGAAQGQGGGGGQGGTQGQGGQGGGGQGGGG